MSVVLHHLDHSRSHRILWLLEELGIEYSIVEHKRDPKTMRAPKAMRELHPLGKAPIVVIDGDVFAESGNVAEELGERFGPSDLWPERGTDAHRRCRYWLHYAEGSLMSPLLVGLISERLRTSPVPFFLKPIVRGIADKIDDGFTNGELELHSGYIEAALADRPYFAGEAVTVADVQMSYPIEAAQRKDGFVGPNARAWLERIRARPAYQRALERGGEPGRAIPRADG
jgi:glutathione S-transferase